MRFATLLLLLACSPALRTLPTGRPLSPQGSEQALLPVMGLRAGQPAALALSPDGTRLLTLTSGFNRVSGADGKRDDGLSTEWLFVHAVGQGTPRMLQSISVPNAFRGLAWAADGRRFFASGGSDDVVREYALAGAEFREVLPPIALGHAAGLGVEMKPMVAGLAIHANTLVVANYEDDSITLVDLAKRAVAKEIDLRPGKQDPAQCGRAGGEFPIDVAVTAAGRAYVACVRDDEVVEIDLASAAVAGRVHVAARPVALAAVGERIYVLSSEGEEVAAIEHGAVVARWPVLDGAVTQGRRGSNPSALLVQNDALYVALGALNLVSVIPFDGRQRSLLPTGWYPDALASDGGNLYIANARSPEGPNPKACRDAAQVAGAGKAGLAPGGCRAANQYVWQLVKGSLQTLPLPSPGEARALTADAAARLRAKEAAPVFANLRGQIRHVIYVVKENRTYDQVLGDLKGADGDPRLALFPEAITPNHHALARQFVTLDRFFVTGHVSGDGWNWSTAARASHVVEMEVPVQYAGRGFAYDYEGQNRNVNVSLESAERRARAPELPDDDDLLPGDADVARPGTGYLWSAAIRKGLTVRNYGFFGDDQHYNKEKPGYLRPSHDAAGERAIQFIANEAELRDRSDPYFRTFDMTFPDYWNEREWEREFDGHAQRGDLPALTLLRLPHDHFGSFGEALDGVDTPDTQIADNDYALGRVVEKLAKSRYAGDTVLIALEDDAQDGPDHVDAQRSFLLVAGAHVRQGVVSSTPRNTVDVLRTIEELLGLEPMSLLDAGATPIAELFTETPTRWTYEARVPAVLRSTRLPVPAGPVESPRGGHAAWQRATAGFDFSHPDALDAAAFNRILVELSR